MKALNLVQGSPEWLAHRATHDNASEASIVMAASTKTTRRELLKTKSTGVSKEYSAFVEEVLFAHGHKVEALARPFAEAFIGEDLYPVTGVSDEHPRLSASFDGLTMAETIAWECKQWNEAKAADVRAGRVPAEDIWQCVQQLTISNAEKLLYTLSDGTEANTIHTWLLPDAKATKDLLAGWEMFNADLASFVPVEEKAPAVATVVESLPVPSVKTEGKIAVISNLDLFGAKLKTFVAGINKEPTDDQGFADAEAAVKTLKSAEDALEQAESAALSQTASIEEMRRTVKDYIDIARTTRLLLDNMVKRRKESLRVEMVAKANSAVTEHIGVINKRLVKVRMPALVANFGEVIKGKKTLSGLQDAIDKELTRVKLEANAIAEKIDANLASLRELAVGHELLFADAQQLVLKDNADLVLLIKSRITEHKAKIEADAETAREKIRAEEAQKLADKAEADRLAAIPPQAPAPPPTPVPALAAAAAVIPGYVARQSIDPAPATSGARIKLGEINARIHPLSISADGLAQLGFQSVGTERAAKLYDAAALPQIIRVMVQHLSAITQLKEAA